MCHPNSVKKGSVISLIFDFFIASSNSGAYRPSPAQPRFPPSCFEPGSSENSAAKSEKEAPKKPYLTEGNKSPNFSFISHLYFCSH